MHIAHLFIFISFLFVAWNLECKLGLYVNYFSVIYFPQSLECINRFNVIVLGACVRECVYALFLSS